MNEHLHISPEGLEFIKSFEGLYLKPYYDAVHVLTIGYGHTNMDGIEPKVTAGLRITKEEATEILKRSLARHYEPSVYRIVKVPLTQHEFDALVSFVYNCGEGNLTRLVRYLNKGDYKSVAKLLPKYNRAGGRVLRGLTRRRAGEVAMWTSQPYRVRDITEDHKASPEAPQEPKAMPSQSPQEPQGAPVPEAPTEPQVPTNPNQASKIDPPSELPDKVAKWGAAVSPFAALAGALTDWRVVVVLVVAGFLGTGAYLFWRHRTKPKDTHVDP